jgi:[protein-PII] uridylyltransferase
LLADVASVTAGHGLDVFGCRVWVTGSGEAVMSLHLNACNPGKWSNTEAWQRLEKDLRTVAQGHLDTSPFIERRRGMISAEKRPDSGFDDIEVRIEEITTAATVLDIKARDSAGLLARLCGCIADRECRIDFASVNTMGEAAVDVFYITRDGQRLGPEEAADLRRAVERSVEVESKLTKGS